MIGINNIVKVRTADGEFIARVVGRSFEEHPHYDVMFSDGSVRANIPARRVTPTGGSVLVGF